MTATFSTSQIAGGNRVLVQGTDALGVTGQTIVDSTQWDEVQSHRQFHVAEEDFDEAVEAFFAPLLAASEAMGKAIEKPERDSINYVTLHEGSEGVPAEKAHIVKLDRDAVILRIIDSGDFARLVWVNGELEVLEVAVNVPAQPVVDSTADFGVPSSDAGLG